MNNKTWQSFDSVFVCTFVETLQVDDMDSSSSTQARPRRHTSTPPHSANLTTIHLRVNKLKILPKINVINVQLRIITLYGIEKSGVGRSTKSVGVYMRPGMLPAPTVTGKRTAGGRSHPRIASGGCSVYFRNVLPSARVSARVWLGGRVSVAWSAEGPWWPLARTSGGW